MKAIDLAVELRRNPAIVSRLQSKVDRRGPDDCWPWLASGGASGHGQFVVVKGYPVGAHRMAWIIANDADPRPYQVMHRCDNPPCCNPAHLLLGTHAENLRDASVRGLMPVRIPDSAVIDLRYRVAAGQSVRSVAGDLGIEYSTAKRMVSGWLRPYVGGPLTRPKVRSVYPNGVGR